ncbi:MAG: putative LacI family transcriptional regulator [Chloroflexi bacterium OLB15]|nr:MAG: putative LacI family transcriptional regulator [Chloroflexi bacterium OLB15]
MPTIKDVAREAGVSIATVSYVLNNKPDAVSEETRQEVWKAVKRIGYTPNVTARNLRSSQSRLIGYAWHQVPADQVNPVLDQFTYFLAHYAEEAGYHILTFAQSPENPLPVYDELSRSGRVDAFVISGTNWGDKRIGFLQERAIPFVSFGRADPGWDFDWVDVDGASGTRQAVDYLVSLGHRRIAFAGWDEGSLAGTHRLAGYTEGLAAAGLPLLPQWIFRGYQNELSGSAALKQYLSLPEDERPTAVVTVSDLVAIGVKNSAEQLGLEIGSDLSIIGFDDSPFSQYLNPPLTTINQPVKQIAQIIIRILEEQLIKSGQPRDFVHELVAPKLIIRSSCGTPLTQRNI